ncbi:hypothetical protein Q5424_15220, partial [Conexibacter sp. JD483]
GSGDEGRAGTPPTGSTATQPPAATLPGSPPLRRYRPPAIPLDRGSGAAIGGTVRLVYTTSTFRQVPRDFVTGGIPIGTRAGDCEVPAITPAMRVQLQAAVERQTPDGEVDPLTPLDVLVADCGDEGRWAMVTWVQHRGRADTSWVDELRDEGGGIWSGTARGVQPGCRMPRAAAAAWQLDVTVCPPKPRPRAAPQPRPAPRIPGEPRDPRRRGGPLQGLPPGSSRA